MKRGSAIQKGFFHALGASCPKSDDWLQEGSIIPGNRTLGGSAMARTCFSAWSWKSISGSLCDQDFRLVHLSKPQFLPLEHWKETSTVFFSLSQVFRGSMLQKVSERKRSLQNEYFRPVWQQGSPASGGLNFPQPDKGIFIDCYTKIFFWVSKFLIPRTLI